MATRGRVEPGGVGIYCVAFDEEAGVRVAVLIGACDVRSEPITPRCVFLTLIDAEFHVPNGQGSTPIALYYNAGMPTTIITIRYEGRSPDEMIALLREHGIERVLDLWSPFSSLVKLS